MKGRESGMPEAEYWQTFFDSEKLLKALIPQNITGSVIEFGSGYGTFTLPLGRLFPVKVIGLDIEIDLINQVKQAALDEKLSNIELRHCDFVEEGTGLLNNSVEHVMLYNILHIENPQGLLSEAFRILAPGGTLSVIHWRSDIHTPRGPSLEIRPTEDQCIQWAMDSGFSDPKKLDITESAPYHYSILLAKQQSSTKEK